MLKNNKITFCTTCMGRLEHLKITLEQNLSDHSNDPEVEFLILDYSCPDRTFDWVRSNFSKEINLGKISCYRFEGAQHFWHSHAKNMAARLAKGNILVTLDADNFTGFEFSKFIRRTLGSLDFLVGGEIGEREMILKLAHSFSGRLVIWREIFEKLGGYDEDLVGYGYEDNHLNDRLIRLKYKGKSIESQFLKCLDHSDTDRMKFQTNKVIGPRDQRRLFGSCAENFRIGREKMEKGEFTANPRGFGLGSVVSANS